MSTSGKAVVVCGGKRGVLSTGKTAVFDAEGNCAACCGCRSEQYGILNSSAFGWQPAPQQDGTSVHGTFRFEDSANCGGPNGNVQGGRAVCRACFAVPMTVSYRLAGPTERQNAGYDISSILRDGAQRVVIGGTEEHLGCAMLNHEAVAQEVVAAGPHTFEFRTSTIDGLYHMGMTHTFLVDWEPAP